MSSLYDFDEVLAQNASTKDIRDLIKDVLKAKDSKGNKNVCYAEIERRLLPPGIAGSRIFDQANAVRILLDHDKKHGALIHVMMTEKGLSERMLWDYLYKVFKAAGFRMKAGRMVGLIADQGDQPEDDPKSEPDIE